MDDDNVGIVAKSADVGIRRVGCGAKVGVGFAVSGEPLLPGILQEIREAPVPSRLKGFDLMAAPAEFTQHTPQEMCVAVVPAGDERMREVDDSQAASVRTVWPASRRS